MTKAAENPWLHMKPDTSRRIDIETAHDFFWVTDSKNRYGLLIKFGFPLTDIEIAENIKGISVIPVSDDESGKLYFILTNNGDWEIFLSVCTNLVFMASKCANEISMIPVINLRIKRWQKFLRENNTTAMTEILQMGLLTELYFIVYSLIPEFGYQESILSWVGPDSDKKDFSLPEFFVEVKSFIASKGRIIKISSLQQLDCEIKPLYLSVYGLTHTNHGISILDMIDAVNALIPEEDYETRDIFEAKLSAYGYMQSVTEPPFFTYSFDLSKSYLVSDDFPKILSSGVDSRILTAQYSIDLAKCVTNEVPLPFNT
ncbi:PD-(D/E)XK motif protein [Mucilaginibacter sabulilitoris]|uniref:PD-(D/E)XK motif protein n=1 Tax=Mucilaginibacter sabulilitoris TaxID=1173583 RepID=A0ABZ0TI52_9SPHI|nr:PD-(D/E)XK motif protein [Mucilaginibacter sabulilitoris]WPU92491.1 PD-(D/E)XK motif protein [Mucilaginibacter sabulilitoris]